MSHVLLQKSCRLGGVSEHRVCHSLKSVVHVILPEAEIQWNNTACAAEGKL